jgi:hypothetical protein
MLGTAFPQAHLGVPGRAGTVREAQWQTPVPVSTVTPPMVRNRQS